MVTFNFNPIKKPIRQSKVKEEIIVEKNVTGVIHITTEGKYFIPFKEEIYYIAANCYDCKGKKILFYQGLINGNNIKVIRLDESHLSDYGKYLPFTVGCYVKGNLIKENGLTKFFITKLLKYDETIKIERVKAIKFFKEHYDEICQNLML